MSLLDHAALSGLIPHAGPMCLLDSVEHWDDDGIICLSRRYAQPDNPMRRADGTLGVASLIEVAAQAMAVHGRLRAGDDTPPRPGFLVSLRDVTLQSPVLAEEGAVLTISARQLMGDARGASYAFSVQAGSREVLEGRCMVLFEASFSAPDQATP